MLSILQACYLLELAFGGASSAVAASSDPFAAVAADAALDSSLCCLMALAI